MKLISHPMRFGTRTFNFHHRALLVSKTPLDATEQTSVEGFTISGAQPADTDRRIIFKIDDTLYKFNGADLVEFDGDIDVDDVLSEGNTVSELTALTDIPAFVGKEIYPIIALFADVTALTMPSIKMTLKLRNNNERFIKTTTDYVRTLTVNQDESIPRIMSIDVETTCTGDGSVEVTGRIRGEDGTWSAYLPTEELIGMEGDKIQFRTKRIVTKTDGTDSAKVNYIRHSWTTGSTAVNDSNADLYSVVQNYESDLQTCYLVVKHDPLNDSAINAFVNFMTKPKRRELITLGTANGSIQQLTLGVNGVKDTGIDQSSILLYADGVPLTEFDYNVEVSEITIKQNSGTVITASYDYGHDVEEWLPMEKVIDSQPYLDDGTYMSRFSYTLADNETAGKSISNVRIQMTRPSGKVTNQSLGKATGKTQMIALPHRATQSTISLNADWTYEPDSQILTFVAAKNTALTLSYSWLGEQVIIKSFTAGWAAAV